MYPVFLTRTSYRRVDFQQHPNEYIRGATLRFLQKIKEPELLEPLIPTCRSCLVRMSISRSSVSSSCFLQEHRHSYVRKNAVLAVYSIYRSFEQLIPDAPELMQTFLAAESDTTCKRNAFIFLANCATTKAVEWVLSVYDQILGFEDLMQLAVIDMIRKDCKGDTPNRVFLLSLHSSEYYINRAHPIAQVSPMHLRTPQRRILIRQVRSRHDPHNPCTKSSGCKMYSLVRFLMTSPY